MSENAEVRAIITAQDDASPVINRLVRSIEKLHRLSRSISTVPPAVAGMRAATDKARAAQDRQAAAARRAAGLHDKAAAATLRKRMDFVARMQTQRVREERRQEAVSLRALRQRLTFHDRMTRQRLREERRSATDLRRDESARRREERQHRSYLDRLDRQSRSRRRDLREGVGRMSDGAGRAARGAGLAGAAVTAGAAVAGRRILGIELDNDTAAKNAQAFGGLSADAVRRFRKEWAEPMSVALGSSVADMLSGFTEALKLGIPDSGAKEFTALSQKAAEAWSMPVDSVTDTLGQVNTILTANGAAFDPKRLASVVNVAQALAAKMSTTPEKLLEFQRQGAGAAAMLKMSQEAALAFGAASTSLGNKAGESGTLLDYIAGRVIELPTLAKRQGQEGQSARELVKSLGYGSAAGLERQRLADPDAFLFDFIERFGRIRDPRKRDMAVRTFAGREWFGEFGRLTTGGAKMREAAKIARDPGSQGAIDALWRVHETKLLFSLRRLRASLGVVLGGFGEVLTPFVQDLMSSLSKWLGRSGQAMKINFWAAMRGLVEGFLGRPGQFRDLLNSWFGAGGMAANPKAFFDFAKGFADGLRTIWETVAGIMKGIGSTMGIDTASPEGMGKLTGLLLGGGIAGKLASPATDMLKDLGLGAGGAAVALRSLFGLGGGTAAAGTAGALAGASKAIPQVAIAGVVGVEILRWSLDPRQYEGDALRRMGEAGGGAKGVAAAGPIGTALLALRAFQLMIRRKVTGESAVDPAKGSVGSVLIQKMGGLTDTIDQSNLIHKAALQRAGLTAHLSGGELGGLITPASYSRSSLSGESAASSATSSNGGALPGFGVSRSGSIMTTGGKGMLDAIATAEGTAGRGDYEAVLGYGRYGTPSKPLTQMTLAEAFAFGREIKARHGSSSAIGRYQIVGNTMRDAAGALGLDWNTTRFDAATQDRMAQWIAGRQGPGAWEGFKRNPGALSMFQASLRGSSGITAAPGQQAGAVDVMSSMLGMSETGPGRSQLNGFMRSMGTRIDAARTAWCAGFVNSSLAAVGMKGTGKLNANSFLNWGDKIDPSQVMKGDVLVEHRGLGAGDTGGHVGMATGNTRVGPNGERQIEMISGNSGGRLAGGGAVRTTWESANSLAVRRATAAVPTPQSITSGVPRPASSFGAGGAGGGGSTMHAPITVHAAPGQSPTEIAAAVERRLSERRNSYQVDVEHA